MQNNDWSLQLLSKCDLTPDTTLAGETQVDGYWLYRFDADSISQSFTKCSTQDLLHGSHLQPAQW